MDGSNPVKDLQPPEKEQNKTISNIKKMLRVKEDNEEALEKKTGRKKVISNRMSEMKRIFEPEKCPKKKLKMKTVSDESWVGRGCNNPDMLRKRKVEFDTLENDQKITTIRPGTGGGRRLLL